MSLIGNGLSALALLLGLFTCLLLVFDWYRDTSATSSDVGITNGKLADGCPGCGSQRVRENSNRKPTVCFKCGWSK